MWTSSSGSGRRVQTTREGARLPIWASACNCRLQSSESGFRGIIGLAFRFKFRWSSAFGVGWRFHRVTSLRVCGIAGIGPYVLQSCPRPSFFHALNCARVQRMQVGIQA